MPAIIVDCSHGNSSKNYKRQKNVLKSVVDQKSSGNNSIKGFMLESNLIEGNQKIPDNLNDLTYGQSITDACIGWEETETLLLNAYDKLPFIITSKRYFMPVSIDIEIVPFRAYWLILHLS